MKTMLLGAAIALAAITAPGVAGAAEIKVLTAGAFKQVLLALLPDFERQTGHKVTVENDTVGALSKRIEGGEAFDVAVLTPAAVISLTGKGKLVDGTRSNLARVGIGVMVKAGTPMPDIASVEAFKRALLDAKSVALYRSGERRLERHLRGGPAREARHRRSGQAEGQVEEGRLCCRSHREWRGRARNPPDSVRSRQPGE